MSYNITKFPADVSRLFRPRPPLAYKKPVDYPLEKRQTCPHITDVSKILEKSLAGYLDDFPQGSDNKHLNKYEIAASSKTTERRELEDKLGDWDPQSDPNIKDTDPFRTVFVGRLPYDISEIELQRKFNEFGEIEKVRVVRDKTTNQSKGYAFVVFTDPQSSKSACKEYGLHRGIEIKGRTCIVDIERGRTVKYFKPRRLGGGLGGRGYTKADKMARISNNPAFRYGDRPHRKPAYEANRFPPNYAPKPRYTGPSRFSNTTAPISSPSPAPAQQRYIPHDVSAQIPSEPAFSATPVQTSYRSRNARAQETRQTSKPEEFDY